MLNYSQSRTHEINEAAKARGDNRRTRRATLWNVLVLLQSLPMRDATPHLIRELHQQRLSDTIAMLLVEYEDASFINELKLTEKAIEADVSDFITASRRDRE